MNDLTYEERATLRMKAWPREEQEEVYLMFYSAYLGNLEENNEEAAKNEKQLLGFEKLWEFSDLDVGVLKAHGDRKRAHVLIQMDLFFPDSVTITPPTLQ